MSLVSDRLRVWCLLRDQHAHVKPVERFFGRRAEFLYDSEWNPRALEEARPSLVLCVNDYPQGITSCLDVARERRIPTLVLQDGILEWRCQYENPLFGSGGGAPQHQPVLADRIACIGNQSGRQIAAWGNAAKVAVTGMPRLDHLLERRSTPPHQPGSRLLVMTAKNPGFTPDQFAVTICSLRDLWGYLKTKRDLVVVWRTSRNVARELGVESEMRECASEELADILDRVDAVVTTPSTAMLEAMLRDRPVAALDYHNVPRFVPTAWTISAAEQIAPVVSEILEPPARKMAYQRDSLSDCLLCDGPAAPRVASLIVGMVRDAGGNTFGLDPQRFGWVAPPAVAEAPRAVSLAELYPDQPHFRDNDVASCQARIARLSKENSDLRQELARFTLGKGIHKVGRRVAKYFRARMGAN